MPASLSTLRQSAAEMLGKAVLEIFPGALFVEAHSSEFGFHCDIIAEQPINEMALPWLEEKMRGYFKGDVEIRALDMMRENAVSLLTHKEQPYIAARLRAAPENIVKIFQAGEFYDYLPSLEIAEASELKAFKLLEVEQVTRFFADEGSVKVTRIHGLVSSDPKKLKQAIKATNAGLKVSHQEIGKTLNLFDLQEKISALGCIWLNNGTLLRKTLLDWWQTEHLKQAFDLIASPPLVKSHAFPINQSLNAQIPHFLMEDSDYILPSSLKSTHALLFKKMQVAEGDLPVRLAECNYIVQQERSPKPGLLGVDLVYADQAHIFCRMDDVVTELISFLQFINKIIKIFSLEGQWYLRGQGVQSTGTPHNWESGLAWFKSAFAAAAVDYEHEEHEYALHGPAAELVLVDSLGRQWKGPRIGVDFDTPKRLELKFDGAEGKKNKPVLIERSIFGSLERFIALLTEHYAGNFPLWLAPEQIRIVSAAESHKAYVLELQEAFLAQGWRVKSDLSSTQLSQKIRAAKSKKIPYIIVVGENEEKQKLITVRSGINESIPQGMTLETFLSEILQEASEKKLC